MIDLIFFFLYLLVFFSEPTPQINQKPIWISGENGYDTYRIPALVVSNKGSLLAFCEGRKSGQGDSGNIDMLIKRSTDSGSSWSDQQIVWNDNTNTCGNPCPVVDRKTGTIWLLMNWNLGEDREPDIIDLKSRDTRRVFITSSDDDGLSWQAPKEITSSVKLESWTWYATGPGAGIQIERGKHSGRLIIPCDHIEAGTKHYYSHVIFSDDGGNSWELGGSSPNHLVNECQVVELSGERLMLNMRNYDRSKKSRQIAISKDGGISWQGQKIVDTLIEPICQAGFRRYAWPEVGNRNIILFSNPANQEKRINMTVRVSYNEAESWPVAKSLTKAPSAYSDLAVLADNYIACLYETGKESPYDTITFARFNLSWLESEK